MILLQCSFFNGWPLQAGRLSLFAFIKGHDYRRSDYSGMVRSNGWIIPRGPGHRLVGAMSSFRKPEKDETIFSKKNLYSSIMLWRWMLTSTSSFTGLQLSKVLSRNLLTYISRSKPGYCHVRSSPGWENLALALNNDRRCSQSCTDPGFKLIYQVYALSIMDFEIPYSRYQPHGHECQ